jgi:putative transposase
LKQVDFKWRSSGLSPDEIIAKQEAKIRLLEAQLEYVKKLDRNERRLIANGKSLSPSDRFNLIQEAVQQGFGRMTRYLCQLLDVSRSGYYNYLNSADKRQERALADEQAGALIKKAFNRRGYKKGSAHNSTQRGWVAEHGFRRLVPAEHARSST